MTAPILKLAVVAAILAYLLSMPKQIQQPKPKQEGKPRGPCQSKYCYGEMWVDKPKNTEMKDQSLGAGLRRPEKLPRFADVERKLGEDYFENALRSPGVNLVAREVAEMEGDKLDIAMEVPYLADL